MRRALFVGLVPLVVVVASCLGPTEVMVTITTNACDKLTRTDVYVGSSLAPSASVGGCTDGQTVGTLAFVPSGSLDDRIDIAVIGAVGGACSSQTTQEGQCIIARRSLVFLPHQRLDLPIFLDSRCANTPCGPDETCEADPTPHCKSKTCGSDGGVVCESDAGEPDVETVDVGPDVPDVVDAAVCPVLQIKPTFSWSFDNATDAVHEDNGATNPEPFTGGSIGKDPPLFCGNYLLAPNKQVLASGNTTFSTKTFTIAFAYAVTTDGTLITLDSQNLNSGFSIAIAQGSLVVQFQKVSNIEVYRDGGKTNEGAWHTAIVDIATTIDDAGITSSTVRVTRDGVVSKVAGTPIAYPAFPIGISAGPITGGIDQVSFTAF